MRDAHVTALEHSCSPIQLITGLGLDPVKSGIQYTITCPSCRNRLFVLKTGFLCENLNCDFRAGGILDFLKLAENLPTYGHVIDRLETIFPKAMRGQLHTRDYKSRLRAETRLTARRDLFNLLRKLATTSPDDDHGVTTKGKIRQVIGDDALNRAPFTIYPLWHEHYKEFYSILNRYGLRNIPKFTDQHFPMLIPYFSNHHTVGVLGYMTDTDQNYLWKELEASKYQFFGLLQASPKTTDFYLSSGFRAAVLENSKFSQTDPSKLALHCTMKGSDSNIDWLPETFTYIAAEQNKWASIINLGLDMPVHVATGTKTGDISTLIQDHIVNLLTKKITTEGFTPDVEYIIEIAQLYENVPIIRMVRDGLEIAGNLDALNTFKMFLHNKVLSVEGEEKLYQTQDGYFYSNKGVDYILSNFSLEFHRGICFDNSAEIYYEVDLSYSDRQIPMLLAHEALHQPKALERSLQQVPHNEMDFKMLNGLPVLYEVGGRKAGMLLRYLKRMTSKLPLVKGINNLGWSLDRKRFYAPNWVGSADGIIYSKNVFSPGNEMLKLFTTDEKPVRKVHQQLPLDFTHFMAQAVGLLFRSYHNAGLMAVPILREGQGENFLRRMFQELGQQSPLHFNESQWIRSVDVHGFPVYGTGCDYRKAYNVKQAVFMLTSDRGQRIDTCYSDDVFEKAGQTIRQVFDECVRWMLVGEGVSFENHRSVDPNFILAKEGARVIQRAMGIEWHIHTPVYNVLDTLLSHIPFENTQDFMIVDLNKRMLELKLTDLPAVDSTDLQLELSQFANGVTITPHGVAANDADMNRLILNYYQDTPRVEQIFVPPSS